MKTNAAILVIALSWRPGVLGASETVADSATISTFSALTNPGIIQVSTGVDVISDASLTLQGASGYVTTASSVTSSTFFGDGSGLTGLPLPISTQTFTGADTFASTFTVVSGGREVILSTGAGTSNLDLSPSGVVTFYPELHNSSSTMIPTAASSAQLCGPCISGSTLTITTAGNSRVEVVFTGGIVQNSNIAALNFLQDGAFVGNLANNAYIFKNGASSEASLSFRYVTDMLPAGAHAYCLALCTGGSGSSANLNKPDLFSVKELK